MIMKRIEISLRKTYVNLTFGLINLLKIRKDIPGEIYVNISSTD